MSLTFHVIHPPREGEAPSEDAKEILTLSGSHEMEVFDARDGADRETLLTMWGLGSLKVHAVKENGKIIAYALWIVNRSMMVRETDGVLVAAYVKPEHRNNGAFKLLISAGKIAVSSAGATRLLVVVDKDSKAKKFFERDGAKELSTTLRW